MKQIKLVDRFYLDLRDLLGMDVHYIQSSEDLVKALVDLAKKQKKLIEGQ
jgi:hypothetical protein